MGNDFEAAVAILINRIMEEGSLYSTKREESFLEDLHSDDAYNDIKGLISYLNNYSLNFTSPF